MSNLTKAPSFTYVPKVTCGKLLTRLQWLPLNNDFFFLLPVLHKANLLHCGVNLCNSSRVIIAVLATSLVYPVFAQPVR